MARNGSYLTWSSGRATYSKAVQLGNKATRTLINFNTNFSFFVTNKDKTSGDGLVFFLAENRLLPSNSKGECLGIMDCERLNSSQSPIVAVEFDNHKNSYDPDYDHFGIDINSLASIVTSPWSSKSRQVNAQIRYDSNSKNLTVFVTYDDMPNSPYNILHAVDLRDFLPEWVFVGFAASTGGLVQKHTILSWDFNSTLATNIGNHQGSKRNMSLIIGLSSLGVFGVLVLVSILIWFHYKRDWIVNMEEQTGDQGGVHGIANTGDEQTHCLVNFDGVSRNDMFGNRAYGPMRFSFGDLAEATSNFGGKGFLKSGGFGTVYKGFLKAHNMYVAIKRFNASSSQGMKEFEAEVNIISQLKHRNLVKLFGYYHDDERKDLILVYEFMHNGSLHDNLFSDKTYLLTWEKRYDIAIDLAHGLHYLHEGCEEYVVHRDIKSANVLLDSNFRAKLGDFGLARLVEQGNDVLTTYIAGTKGYLAPECLHGQKPSKESDVYSFGIVLLEIGCGKRALEYNGGTIQELVEWVWELYGKGKILKAIDKRLSMELHKQQMERLLVLGLWCAHPNRLSRPSIQTALQVLLSKEAKLPDLPPKMPEGTNLVVHKSSSSNSAEHSTRFPKNIEGNILQDEIEGEEDED